MAEVETDSTDEVNGFENTYWTHPIVDAEETKPLEEALNIVTLLLSLFNFNNRIRSGYYFWHAGLSLGTFTGTLFTSIDRWGEFNWITPKDPWLRYEK